MQLQLIWGTGIDRLWNVAPVKRRIRGALLRMESFDRRQPGHDCSDYCATISNNRQIKHTAPGNRNARHGSSRQFVKPLGNTDAVMTGKKQLLPAATMRYRSAHATRTKRKSA